VRSKASHARALAGLDWIGQLLPKTIPNVDARSIDELLDAAGYSLSVLPTELSCCCKDRLTLTRVFSRAALCLRIKLIFGVCDEKTQSEKRIIIIYILYQIESDRDLLEMGHI
jgi:hypothetical protein